MIWLGVSGDEEQLNDGIATLSEEEFEITREARTASGRLVIDIIAVKKRFVLNYGVIMGSDLGQLKRIYNLSGIKSLIIQQQDGTQQQYDVVFRPFARENYLRAGEWHWRGISLVLEEV